MNTLHCLVDYYNQATLRRGVPPNYADHHNAVELIADRLHKTLEQMNLGCTELRIRLYGGWSSSETGAPTIDREILGALIRKLFPTRSKRIRIFVQAIDSLACAPDEQLIHTVRPLPGLIPFKLNRSISACPLGPQACALPGLDSWRRGRCPQHAKCGCTTEMATVSVRQKLIDTMIVADTITLAVQTENSWVAAVSNDDDIIPGIMAAAAISKRVFLIRYGRREPSPYDEILSRRSITLWDEPKHDT